MSLAGRAFRTFAFAHGATLMAGAAFAGVASAAASQTPRTAAVAPSPARPASRTTPAMPPGLSDGEFWALVTQFSETGGYFQSDNFVSNEATFQWVIPDVVRAASAGGAYLGVGPDQNFPYIVALRPTIAFIFDIRRQNLLTHLMYKALFEQATDRADFLSRLFARPRPAGLDASASPDQLLLAFREIPADSAFARRQLATIQDRLTRVHRFPLSAEDTAGLAYVYRAFVNYGPDISYDANRRAGFGVGRMPTYAQLQVQGDSARVQRGYLASDANFRLLRAYEVNNLIVPVVGDFAGTKAIRGVADYLSRRRLTVSAFYLSNVEQYLFNQHDDWKKFFANAGTLPIDAGSMFIRSAFNGMGPGNAQLSASAMRSQQLRASMVEQLKLFADGKILSYYDILSTSR